MARPKTRSRAAGLRATPEISAAKMWPIPTPTPASAIIAIPAPMAFAEARSMCQFLSLRPLCSRGAGPAAGSEIAGRSVQMHRVVQIDAGQDGEHVSLQRSHQQFEADQHDVDAQR